MSGVYAESYTLYGDIVPAAELRVALVHAGTGDIGTLTAILAGAGIALTGTVLPVRSVGSLSHPRPDAIVLSTELGDPRGLAALRVVHGAVLTTPIVAVAPDAARVLVRQALNAGASGLVAEHEAAVALAPAVRAVVAGLVCAPHSAAPHLAAKPTFTHREKQILELLVIGMTNQEIAGRLYLAESTIKGHLVTAFAKLGVSSRKEAAAILLDPDEGLRATALPPRHVRLTGLSA
jgi:DNA-binding NarL/FixJ family response regulator